jgi:GNAT superfamily N-acetyltransferase
MSWHIRPAAPEDARRISEINLVSLGYDFSPEQTKKRLMIILPRKTDRIFVARRDPDGLVGGYLHAADYENVYSGSMKNIMVLAVDKAFQGQGLGRLLLGAAEAWAEECGCTAIRLVSGYDRVNAHAFYAHCGYNMRKEEKNFIKYLDAAEK